MAKLSYTGYKLICLGSTLNPVCQDYYSTKRTKILQKVDEIYNIQQKKFMKHISSRMIGFTMLKLINCSSTNWEFDEHIQLFGRKFLSEPEKRPREIHYVKGTKGVRHLFYFAIFFLFDFFFFWESLFSWKKLGLKNETTSEQ